MDDFATLQSSVQSSLIATTRSVTSLAAEDVAFHRSLDPTIGTQFDSQNARLLNLAQRLLGTATTNAEVRPSLKDIDDVEGNWTQVVDIIDSLLERADTALDEFTGAVKRLTPRENTPNVSTQRLAAAFRNQDIKKPQLLFDDRPNNSNESPFVPLLTAKPHSNIPLQTSPSELKGTGHKGYEHPYQHEIETYAYPDTIYDAATPIAYNSFEETQSIFVDTEEALDAMIEELKKAKEIAVDLEHHDQRSYIGIVCLMQISTRHQDWIIDTLVPWRRKLSRLNEVFTDPSIIKVLHGAHMDIVWLQRDFGVYIVGLFDTYHAARVLQYPRASYAYLLKQFTGVDAQKQYQLADWRIRPLPQELVDYARSDTHYLLYVYDNMRNELIQKSNFELPNNEGDNIFDVLGRSKETALQRYERPVYDADSGIGPVGWYKMLIRTPVLLSKQQFAVLKAVHAWRDKVAREQDDNPHYIIPDHMLFAIAKMIPLTKVGLLQTAQPLTQTIRLRADEIVAEIVRANEEGVDGPDMMDVLKKRNPLDAKNIAADLTDTANGKVDGVSGYLGRVVNAGRNAASSILSALPLRSASSLFWGPSFDNKQKRSLMTSVPAVQLAVPLPALTEDIFAETSPVTPAVPAVEKQPVVVQEEADDDVFTLKELNKKRKLAQVEDEDDDMADQDDIVALPDEQQERLRLKAARKQSRREAKRAAKDTNGHADETLVDETPFDYASAPSVLAQQKQDKKQKKGRKTFSPYSKTMDAPKGLSRSQKEGAGRTMTFAP